MPLPKVGEIVDGYAYGGGDPNSQKSWRWVGDGAQAAAPLQGDAPGEPLTPGSESRTRVTLGLGPAIEAQQDFAFYYFGSSPLPPPDQVLDQLALAPSILTRMGVPVPDSMKATPFLQP